MELDELKKTWTSVDERLKKNESLKDSIILEMMKSKANKSVNRLINFDIFSIIICALAIPYFVYIYNFERFNKFLSFNILMIFTIIYCIVCVVWYFFKIHGLMKIDCSKSLRNNIYFANRYKIQLKREKLLMYVIAIPVIMILVTVFFAENKANTYQWTVLSCAGIVALVVTYFTYKRLYDKNIETILQSLDEIKELEEE